MTAEDDALRALAEAREATDTGNRHRLDDVIAELGIDIDIEQLVPAAAIGLSTINGRPGAMVRWAQRWFMGADPEDAQWTHAFLVGFGDDIFEAQPSGVWLNSLTAYLDTVRAGDQVMFVTVDGMTDERAHMAVAAAETFARQKRGYSWANYVYLAAWRAGLHVEWLRKLIANRKRLICSVAVDQALTAALQPDGLFRDGRASQNVTPADLARWARTDPRARIFDITEVTR